MLFAINYPEAIDAGISIVGGKARTLARLDGYGVPVPRGMIVTAASHDALIQVPEVANAIAAVRNLTDDELLNVQRSAGAFDHLDAVVAAQPPLADERAAVRALLADLGLAHARLAVRSSAVSEDGATHSFAGIHRSVLGVQGEDALWLAIRQCQASFWSSRAIAYRRRAGVADELFGGGVLVCELVERSGAEEPVAAGVIFTCDPVTGDPDVMSIEAVQGFGDKLVDGRITPEQATFSLKTGALHAGPALLQLLSEAVLEELVRTALRIEWALSDGDDEQRFDIEWAHDGVQMFIVQARPVTSLTSRSNALAAVEQLWSRANLTEVLPGILTTFSWSLTRPGIRWTLLQTYTSTRAPIPSDLTMIKRYRGRPYLELSAMHWLSFTTFGILPAQINQSLGGEQPELDIALLPNDMRSRLIRSVNMVRLLRVLARLGTTLRSVFADTRALGASIQLAALKDMTNKELYGLWRSIDDLLLQAPLGLAAGAAVPWLTIAKTILGKALSEADTLSLIGGLLADRGSITSADHGYELLDVAQLPSGPGRAAALTRYLERFGHRGFDELELANPRWGEQPAALESVLAALHEASPKRSAANDRRRVADAQLRSLGLGQRWGLRWLLPKLAGGFQLREEARSENVRLLGGYRKIALEVGRRLHESGQLSDTKDVFMLSVADISAFLNGDWSGNGALKLVADRTTLRNAWAQMADPPSILRDNPLPLSHSDTGTRTEHPVGRSRTINGIAASPGRARGAARLVDHPETVAFRRGDVLVARATDPAWTPLFLAAAAIVVENGGYLSHGAIVAREFGIPAVVNLPGIRSQVRDGQMMIVDGDQGTVLFEEV